MITKRSIITTMMTPNSELIDQENKYREYIDNHKKNVIAVFNEVLPNLKRIGVDDMFLSITEKLVSEHDQSKYSELEFDSYRQRFNPTTAETPNEEWFRFGWLHHLHKNPHHWQYWVLIGDTSNNPTTALKMPVQYLIELLCDWSAMSLFQNNDIIFWYNQHKQHIIMHEETRQMLERMLVIFSIAINEIKKRDESNANNNRRL